MSLHHVYQRGHGRPHRIGGAFGRFLGAILLLTAWAGAAEERFSLDVLKERARALAAAPHVARQGGVPEWLRSLNYDDLRRIQFDGRESLWGREKLPFQLQFLHPGFLYDRSVRVAELRDKRPIPVPFRREYFNYHGLTPGEIPESLGFAGFRVMYPLEGPTAPPSEAGSFLGASYFRFLPRGAAYGLSARGLAINTAEPGPEEFPVFTEFWVERPEPNARTFAVYALLESESVAGAYQFSIAPGESTVVEVHAFIYARKNPAVVGLAPLTSMFWRGENTHAFLDDYRPEVHDSDGLLLHTGTGEWIWRPLENPAHLRVSTFSDTDPRGFGLLQRDRNFENYQDLEASYHLRPGAWVEPLGKWGKGGVRLVELPTKDEFNDNIVAFWKPETLPPAGQPIEIRYRLHWVLEGAGSPAGFVRATRHGKTAHYEPGMERFVVDFDGPPLRSIEQEADVEPVLSIGAGAGLNHATLQKNRINGTWRVAFTVRPDGTGRPVEMRCFLRRGADVLSETWSYLWQP